MSVTASQATDKTSAGQVDWSAFQKLFEADERRPVASRASIGLAVAVALWLVALIAVFLAWNGAAQYDDVALQMPYLLSGGGAALVLTGVGSVVYVVTNLAIRPAESPPVIDGTGAGAGSS